MKKLSPPDSIYRGRFAPSPTGPLHFGSLVTAVGSFLESKKRGGSWLVRMEDLDTPRCVPGAADDILRTLDAFGLHSDEPVIFQSQRTSAYENTLQQLQALGASYPCTCSRKEIADSALHGIEGVIYPGNCRDGISTGKQAHAWRIRTDLQAASTIEFQDALQGKQAQNLAAEIGDFVIKRADGLFAYQLAVVVDDAFQNITHLVRGCDLLASTPRQIYLQRLLKLPTPHYAHLPIAVNSAGEKLSKQTLAAPINLTKKSETLWQVLNFLQQQPPLDLRDENLQNTWRWAHENWRIEKLIGMNTLPENRPTKPSTHSIAFRI